ncbi:MAG: efflux RND transporter periplasmic adaptor subunit [Planctomycetes bacterium]|nr:efflux RND transporter periplasmic adaptor subunit [Planctomycetota bacterium]
MVESQSTRLRRTRASRQGIAGSILLLGLLLSPGVYGEEFKVPSALLTLIEQADISAREAGPLIHREISEGVTVDAETVLGTIDDDEAVLVLDRARTELKIAESLVTNDVKVRFARKSHEAAVAELKRSQESVEKFPKSVSQTELDRLQLLVDKAMLEIEQATVDQAQAVLSQSLKQNDLNRATLQLERRRIKAPFPGMVVQWKRQRGEWVEPGTPVVRMIRLNRLRAEAFVSATQLPLDLVGRSATVIVDLPGKPNSKFEGRLTFVDPEIDPVNAQVRIWVEVNNSNMILRPGQTVSLTIHDARSAD